MSRKDFYGFPIARDPRCRTCVDFKNWVDQQRAIFSFSKNRRSNRDDEGKSGGRKDCPWDKNELGRSTWGLLHTIAAHYPDTPSIQQKRDVTLLYGSLARLYPCEYCSNDFQNDLKENPVEVNCQKGLSEWLCNFHNRVNEKLGKPIFDCSKVDERWRDGWLDGSCD